MIAIGWEWHDRHRGTKGRFAAADVDQYIWAHVRVPTETWDMIAELAKGQRMSMSGYVGLVLMEHVRMMADPIAYARPLVVDDIPAAQAAGGDGPRKTP